MDQDSIVMKKILDFSGSLPPVIMLPPSLQAHKSTISSARRLRNLCTLEATPDPYIFVLLHATNFFIALSTQI